VSIIAAATIKDKRPLGQEWIDMTEKIDFVKVYDDGNYVCYGAKGEDGKRHELARGTGTCPYVKGDVVCEDGAILIKTQATKQVRIPADVSSRALGCAVAFWSEIPRASEAQVLITAEIFETWLMGRVSGGD